jgi:hypothetical protein
MNLKLTGEVFKYIIGMRCDFNDAVSWTDSGKDGLNWTRDQVPNNC